MPNTQQTLCYHCDLPVPKGFHSPLTVLGKSREFCCMGCFTLAETLVNNNLDSYYRLRTEKASAPHEAIIPPLDIFDDQDVQEDFVIHDSDQLSSVELFSENIMCSACTWLIEKRLKSLKGLVSVNVHLARRTIHIQWNQETLQLSHILKQLHAIGYPSQPYDQDEALQQTAQHNKFWLRRLGLAGLGMMQVMMYAIALYIGAFDGIDPSHNTLLRTMSFAIATPVLLYAGSPFFTSAWRGLRSGTINMDIPIVVALTLAYLSSVFATISSSGDVYFDSITMLVFFLLLGRYLEYRARSAAENVTYDRKFEHPLFVEQYSTDSNSTQTVSIKKICIDDIITIKPGATIPFDGVVFEGESLVNEAMLSGEFSLQQKVQNDTVLAGSVNNSQALKIRVNQPFEQGFIQQLRNLQQEALSYRPKIQVLADSIAKYFVSAVLVLALSTYLFWHLVDPENALWIAISVLVISCPCALSLATPVALTCSISALNQQHILVRNKDFMSAMQKITDVVFDKTGTLTHGSLIVNDVQVFTDFSVQESLATIAALEAHLEHPVAQAFHSYHSEHYTAKKLSKQSNQGVSGIVNETLYHFGPLKYIAPYLARHTNKKITEELSNELLYLIVDSKEHLVKQPIIAAVHLQDTVRDSAKQTINALHERKVSVHVLSGDPSQETQRIAQELTIQNAHNSMLPKQKVSYIKKLRQKKGSTNHKETCVLMIGDGVNDAPVMAVSDASIAMQSASDFTKSQADSYLLSDNLNHVITVIDKADATQQVIKQNLAWALLYNLIAIPFAVCGLIPPYLAAVGMSLSSIIVIMNSLRLYRS